MASRRAYVSLTRTPPPRRINYQHAVADALETKIGAVAAALSVAHASAHAEPVALAVSETRKSDGVARLRSDAAADADPDEQPDASSGLLLLHRRLRRLYGAVDDPGLLERKRSVRDQLR